MKVNKTPAWLLLFPAILAIGFFSGDCALASGQNLSKHEHETITQRLIVSVDHNPEIKRLLIKSIEKARKINPDPSTNPAQTLEQYYDFIDWAAKAMPWMLLPKLSIRCFMTG